jgi:hypothetical protein
LIPITVSTSWLAATDSCFGHEDAHLAGHGEILGVFSRRFSVSTFLAVTCEVEVSLHDLHSLPLADLAFDPRDQGSVEFDHLTASTAREMIVRLLVHSLIMAVALTKSMLLHKSQLCEQAKGTVDCRQADIWCTALRTIVYGLGIQMLVALLEYVQDQAAL